MPTCSRVFTLPVLRRYQRHKAKATQRPRSRSQPARAEEFLAANGKITEFRQAVDLAKLAPRPRNRSYPPATFGTGTEMLASCRPVFGNRLPSSSRSSATTKRQRATFPIHDPDASGALIFQALQEGTRVRSTATARPTSIVCIVDGFGIEVRAVQSEGVAARVKALLRRYTALRARGGASLSQRAATLHLLSSVRNSASRRWK